MRTKNNKNARNNLGGRLRHGILAVLFCLVCACTSESGSNSAVRSKILFDDDWLFYRGAVTGAERVSYDDTGWRAISLPHDWSIEDLPGTDSPIDPVAIGGVNTGFFVGGTGWYRKHFNIQSSQVARRFYLQFDGVYMNADIWLNGKHLGNHPYGYTSFGFDITEHLLLDQENVIAVEVKNEGENTRWYSGSGIYRHVWLIATNPVHVAHWGTSITTPEVGDTESVIKAVTRIVNNAKDDKVVTLTTRIIDPGGNEKGVITTESTIGAISTIDVSQEITIDSPELWSVDTPLLYTSISEVYLGSALEDKIETTFGIRTISFDAQNGFQLNGESLLLKGGCMHHGNGPLGSAAHDRAEERRVELMKASGYNAIRFAHNPSSPAFLDACDRLGILVIDEAFDTWKDGKNPDDYNLYFDEWWQQDIESMIFRDWNHPSIIMWSIGNEIPGRDTPEVAEVANLLADYVRNLDPTRPVTAALNGITPKMDPYFAALDVAGYNYKENLYVSDHERLPQRIMYGSESFPLEAFEYWMGVLDNPWVIGDFVWTGFDYLGESSIGWLGYWQRKDFYPWNHAFCGDIDICGFKRPQSYYRDVLWDNGNQPSIFVKSPQPSFPENPEKEDWSIWNWHDVKASWNWEGHEDQLFEVEVYNGSASVELFLNEKSLGNIETNRNNEWIAKWVVPYQTGTLKAVSYDGSEILATTELQTAGEVQKIRLTPDRKEIRADGRDLCYITVELVDSQGNLHPDAENLVDFEIDGPGSILAVGSSNPRSTESYKRPRRKAYEGRCLVIVQSGKMAGRIKLIATSEGLQADQLIINTVKL